MKLEGYVDPLLRHFFHSSKAWRAWSLRPPFCLYSGFHPLTKMVTWLLSTAFQGFSSLYLQILPHSSYKPCPKACESRGRAYHSNKPPSRHQFPVLAIVLITVMKYLMRNTKKEEEFISVHSLRERCSPWHPHADGKRQATSWWLNGLRKSVECWHSADFLRFPLYSVWNFNPWDGVIHPQHLSFLLD